MPAAAWHTILFTSHTARRYTRIYLTSCALITSRKWTETMIVRREQTKIRKNIPWLKNKNVRNGLLILKDVLCTDVFRNCMIFSYKNWQRICVAFDDNLGGIFAITTNISIALKDFLVFFLRTLLLKHTLWEVVLSVR